MIYITGDTHANFHRFAQGRCPAVEDDYIIICGDFGGVWGRTKAEEYWLDWLNEKPWCTLFVDGNHENFDRLLSEEYPTSLWHGGKVKHIRDKVIYLMRGQVFVIEGKKIFTMGGARSHDIDGGILDPEDTDYLQKLREAQRSGLPFRINHISWWQEEMHTPEDQSEGLFNLQQHDWTVDYIVSHCAPTSIQSVLLEGQSVADPINEYFEQYIVPNVNFKRWFFGHYHVNREVREKYTALYGQILPINYAEADLAEQSDHIPE